MAVSSEKALEVRNIDKSYGKVPVLKGLNLDVMDKEFLVLLGPSGCGKTTLLRIIAGLTPMESGSVVLGGKDITNTPPYQRDIGIVFQNYALFPHMNVFQNIAFGLRMRHTLKAEITRRVEESLRIVHLEGLGERGILQLSGGQQQRVALARALVLNPSLLLLDEPLSNLDAKLRVSVRVEIAQIQKQLGITSILVTHDQVEAMTMGDRIILMREGVIQQSDNPINIYRKPVNVFVASFIGSPSINLFDLEVGADQATFNDLSKTVPVKAIASSLQLKSPSQPIPPGRYKFGVRPEGVEFADPSSPGSIMNAEVVFVESLGSETFVHLKINDRDIVVRAPSNDHHPMVGESIGINFCEEHAHLFDAQTQERVAFTS